MNRLAVFFALAASASMVFARAISFEATGLVRSVETRPESVVLVVAESPADEGDEIHCSAELATFCEALGPGLILTAYGTIDDGRLVATSFLVVGTVNKRGS